MRARFPLGSTRRRAARASAPSQRGGGKPRSYRNVASGVALALQRYR
jgi:hypothetical protein